VGRLSTHRISKFTIFLHHYNTLAIALFSHDCSLCYIPCSTCVSVSSPIAEGSFQCRDDRLTDELQKMLKESVQAVLS
jgi:hypothetical protein